MTGIGRDEGRDGVKSVGLGGGSVPGWDEWRECWSERASVGRESGPFGGWCRVKGMGEAGRGDHHHHT